MKPGWSSERVWTEIHHHASQQEQERIQQLLRDGLRTDAPMFDNFYVQCRTRHGLDPRAAFEAARARLINTAEQRVRRLSHGTGAT